MSVLRGKWPSPAIELGAIRADGLIRVPVFVLGDYVWQGLKLSITREVIEQVQRNFTSRNIEVPLSYEHTIEHPDIAKGDPIRAAGFLKELEAVPVRDALGRDVLWGWAEPTDLLRELLEAGEYKYTSPAFDLHYESHTTGEDQGATLVSLAITNRPFLDTPPIQFSAVAWGAATTRKETMAVKNSFKKAKVSPISDGPQKGNVLIEHSDFPATSGSGDDATNNSYYVDASDVKKAMGATEASAADAESVQKIVLLADVAGATSITPAVVTAIAAKVSAAGNSRPVVGMSAVPVKDGKPDFGALRIPKGSVLDGEVFSVMLADQAFDRAVQEGRVLPAEREHFRRIAMSDLDLFHSMLAIRQPVVSLAAAGTSGAGKQAADTVELSAAEKAFAKKMGVSEESALKQKQARLKAVKDEEEEED